MYFIVCIYIALDSSARFERMQLYYGSIFGIILRNDITGSLRDNIIELYYEIVLRDHMTELYHRVILRDNIRE